MEALLQRGASVCVRDAQGRSPLHLASACGRVGALGALLQASTTSNTHLTDNQGYTPLHWACYNGADPPRPPWPWPWPLYWCLTVSILRF